MSSASSVLEDGSLLSKLDKLLFKLETPLALLSGLAVFALIFLAVVSVGGRNLFNQPIPGYIDWIEQAMPLIAFMGVAYTQRLGGHIRMDILIGNLKGRSLWVLEFLTTFAMFALMILLIWGSFSHFDRSFDISAPLWSRDSSLDIRLPLWPAKLLIPVAFSVLAARLFLQLWGYVNAIISGTDKPIAVPLIEDAATVASKEAETVSAFEEKDNNNG